MNSPIIVVGIPRSGSTLLTNILNKNPSLFIVNDFYFLQYVDSVNGFDRTNNELSKAFSREICNRIKARIEREDSPELECGLYFSREDERKLEYLVENTFSDSSYTWYELLENIMFFSAELLNKKIWGYNTPQDFLHIERLEQHFPKSKFIYMMRDPRSLLLSYKNVTSNGYHETNRYHPALQALSWRTAMRSYLQKNHKDNCLLVRYEDLIANTNVELSRIGQFVGHEFPHIDINQFGNNSSFKNNSKKLHLLDTEIWLCEYIARQEMEATNYSLSATKPRLQDIGHITYLTGRVLNFYLSKIVLSPNVRKRVLQVVKNVVGKQPK